MTDEPKVPPASRPTEAPAQETGSAGTERPKSPPAVPTRAAAQPAASPEPWSSPLGDELRRRFPGAVSESVIFRKMPCLTVTRESLLAICGFLRSEEGGGYALLTDETAVDYPKREKRFEIVYHLYTFKQNQRLRLKVHLAEGEPVPSVVSIWPTANWLEREVYDMFGVQYEDHPDLRRILLPEDWTGHPLRKDYDILRQDDAWVQRHLNIKSGQ